MEDFREENEMANCPFDIQTRSALEDLAASAAGHLVVSPSKTHRPTESGFIEVVQEAERSKIPSFHELGSEVRKAEPAISCFAIWVVGASF
jgi:hypothetical protein